ncbi:tetratricopeptide repeat protein [Pseudonocardia hierapolitana]|uniref:Tetratricopeptide repeat protein n=1 Tax=Pseudonocardia hierapolitana TaxID=1128676 RepID=A0A561SH52_9PSEU|nr:helix-turn-helix domain-containing protein [Pseudonocardia hierapolitana]TWF74157.1 tetratricopeptide repeat protein [Pseudonocardia hierapolitana]
MAIGASLRAWRERALLTQEQLAERSGISVRSIRRLEAGGAARPRSSSLELLAAALGLTEAERAALIGAARDTGAIGTRNVPERSGAFPSRPPGAVPRQLPAPPPAFTGRAAESADLERIPDMSTVVITSIDGMAGIGKTALAVHAAHRMAGHFPDGQLFLDLHGYTEGVAPVEPADALDRMLRAIGVPGDQIPGDLDDRAALYRSRMAGRKVLVLLDNAASEAQVAPLLPGTPGCLVVVTSRRRLVGLDQTRVVSLDVLPLPDAVALFVNAAGDGRTAGESAEALAEVVELCGRLPLAVRIAAARLRARPAWSVENLVERLRDRRHRLVELEAGSRSVAAALESSCRDLDPQLRRAYRLLALHPGGELDRYAAAALLDADLSDTGRLIEQLVDAHLLQEPSPGRFGFHDLVRDHARAAAIRDEAEPDRRAAIARLLDHHRYAASAAMDVAYPHERSRRPGKPRARTPVPAFPDPVRAGAWVEGELSNLVAAAQHAAEHGWPEHVSHVGATLHRYLYDRGRGAEAATLHQHALAAARAAGDGHGEADALVLLGKVHWWFHSRLEQAGELFELAAATAHAVGHHLGEVRALTSLGAVRSLQGAHARAADHFAAALARVRHVSDHDAELDALCFLGWHHLRCGEPAVDEFEQCVALARAHSDRNGEWLALHGLGYAHRTDGRFERAIECFEQALHICRAVRDQRGTLGCLIGLACAHRDEGHVAPAASYYEQAIDLAREVGNPSWEYEAVYGLGRLACVAGRAERALVLFHQALDLATTLGRPVADVRAHDGLAHAHHLLNERDHARRHWQRALDILTDLGLTTIGTDISYGDRITTTAIRSHLRDL